VHEGRQELVCVDNRKLASILRRVYVNSFRLESWPEGFPVGGCWYQDDALAIHNCAGREATYGAIEKLLVLVQLNDVIARTRGGKQTIP
jgi:hypothetical protein